MTNDTPKIVMNPRDVRLDAEYAQWIAELKHRYRSAQVKASVRVNGEKLLFNWELGRDLVQKKAEERWGAGVVEQVSLDMSREFPESNNFSARNLWYMKQWYLFYTEESGKLKQAVSEMLPLDAYGKKLQLAEASVSQTEKLKQVVSEFPMAFACVPWGHHIRIVQHSKSLEEALFYVDYAIKEGVSRDVLSRVMKDDLYNKLGKAPNNFQEHLTPGFSRLAQEVLKENYDFGFATVSHSVYDEHELEEALSRSVTDLLLEMGNGFAFLGRQRELITGDNSRKIDLLFYHIRLRCYIVCELKAKPFEPEYAGKLNFYVNAVDDLLKQDDDNPTIGLLICSDMNKADVQWSFRGVSTPMGVATYNNIRIKDMLPTQEQLRERMELLQRELRETKRLMGKTKAPEGDENEG